MNKFKNKIKGKYKSKLEEFCAKELTNANLQFGYETLSIILMPKFKSKIISYEKKGKKFGLQSDNIRAITYKPDFIGDDWIIETKGRETPDFRIKWKLFKKHIEDNNLDYQLYKPTNQGQVLEVIKLIKNGKVRNENCKN